VCEFDAGPEEIQETLQMLVDFTLLRAMSVDSIVACINTLSEEFSGCDTYYFREGLMH
jgi:hypothetical protein